MLDGGRGMNIVFFMQDTGSVFGAERATLDLAAGLREAGESVHFFLIKEVRRVGLSSGLRGAIDKAGFPVRGFPVPGRFSSALARDVRVAFRAAGGEVLHVIGYKANLHAWWSGIRPRVATVHGWLFRDDPKERLYDAIDRWCLRRCDRVICLSRYYENLLRRQGLGSGRLVRIPSGLREIPSEDILASRDRRERAFTFGMMGRFSEEKNHEVFLCAAAEVAQRHPEAKFRIAGQGPLEATLRQKVRELGLEAAVEFCGYCEVAEFMKAIDVYVICSKIENLPYSIMEAMAWGRPVIGSRVGGIPDLVERGKTGWLVDANDPESLAASMIEAMQDRGDSVSRGRAGRTRSVSEFNLSRCVEQHRGLYRELVKQHHA
jgi:glycosyltransferase involved in cell wall biosynthesis